MLSEQILRVGAKFSALERSFVFKYGHVKFYGSEIHLMEAADHNPDVNVSGIARLLGVTKGAISQTLSRLEKKGALVRESAPVYGNELRISLTPFGKDALAAFRSQNHRQWSDFATYVESLPKGEYRAILRFLRKLEAFLSSLG